jgi:hypothetical protein
MVASTPVCGTSPTAGRLRGEAGGSTDRREWCWALVCSGAIVAVSCVPYLIAWLTTPPGLRFGGILVNPLDGYSYLAKMRQGWEGAWLFHLTYTPEPHSGAAIFLLYLGLGHLARLTGLPIIAIYHAARILAGYGLLVTIYAFVSRLSRNVHERRLIFLLSSATAGLGWLGAMVGLFPIDLWVPEAFAFFSVLSNPHFPLAITLMLVALASVLWPASGLRGCLVPGLAGLALGIVAPLALPVLYATILVYLLACLVPAHRGRNECNPAPPNNSRSLPPALLAAVSMAVLSAPWLAYDTWVYNSNPALAAWSAQNVTPTPPFVNVALGFGLFGPLAVLGALAAIRQRDLHNGATALVIWSGVTLALIYAPIPLQRRLITGLGLPVAMLAGVGLMHPLPRTWEQGRWPARARVLAATVGLLGSVFLLYVFAAGALGEQKLSNQPGMLYQSQDEVAGMAWLSANAPGDVVLASPRAGMVLPGEAGVRVFYGHPFETIEATTKAAQAEAFLSGRMSEEEWHSLATQYAIRYVFVGPAERKMGADHLPENLEPVFRQGGVSIYRVP